MCELKSLDPLLSCIVAMSQCGFNRLKGLQTPNGQEAKLKKTELVTATLRMHLFFSHHVCQCSLYGLNIYRLICDTANRCPKETVIQEPP